MKITCRLAWCKNEVPANRLVYCSEECCVRGRQGGARVKRRNKHHGPRKIKTRKIELSEALNERLEARADAECKSVAWVIDDALEAYLD